MRQRAPALRASGRMASIAVAGYSVSGFPPGQLAARPVCWWDDLLRDRLEIEHLLDARHDDQIAPPVLLPAVVGVVRRDRIGVAEAGRAPLRGRQAAALVAHEEQQHLAG